MAKTILTYSEFCPDNQLYPFDHERLKSFDFFVRRAAAFSFQSGIVVIDYRIDIKYDFLWLLTFQTLLKYGQQ